MSNTSFSKQKDLAGPHNVGSGDDGADPWIDQNPVKRMFLAYYRLTGENLHPELIDENKTKTRQKATGEDL